MSESTYLQGPEVLPEAMAILGLTDRLMTGLSLTFACDDLQVRTELDDFLAGLGYDEVAVREVMVELAIDGLVRARVAGAAWGPKGALRGDGQHLLTRADWDRLREALPRLVGRGTRWETR